jgi:hypothetical protein
MSKKKVRLIHWFQAGSFPPTIMFSVGYSHIQIIRYLKKVKAKEWLCGIKDEGKLIDDAKYITLYREIVNTKTERPIRKLYYIIFTESFLFTDYSYSILAHEVLHCTQFLLRPILDIDKEYEAFAYTHTFIMDKCMDLIRGVKKKNKKK